MANKKISELDQTLNLSDQADFPLSQDNAGEPTTFRAKLTQLATKIAEDMTFSNLQTTSKKLVGAINEIRGTILTATLTAGSTTLTISDNSITTDSTIDIYTNTYGVSPSNVSVIAGSITLTFSAQANDIDVKVVIK